MYVCFLPQGRVREADFYWRTTVDYCLRMSCSYGRQGGKTSGFEVPFLCGGKTKRAVA